ncbi:hypothetical protein RV15_GL000874 [Enterococcus silesiacus]|nr:hypothetical protein RV15_GL000874 [Enterococcus silesiacus]
MIVSDIAFTENIVLPCEICHGTRYDPGILQYTYKGKTIVDVLAMTVNESCQFFADQFVKKIINFDRSRLRLSAFESIVNNTFRGRTVALEISEPAS